MPKIELNIDPNNPHAKSIASMEFLKTAYTDAPKNLQPVFPQGMPKEVPFTENQMITFDHLQKGLLPVPPQLDGEAFVRLGCRWDCANCSVPQAVRWAPEVLMQPQFWARVFEITESYVVKEKNPGLQPGEEPYNAPYVRIIGGEPSTYHPASRNEDGRMVSLGNVVDIMRPAKAMPYFMAGLFSDGASLGQQPELMEELVPVLERYHTSVDYMPKEELPDLKNHDTTDRDNRASYGAHVATFFASHGIDSIANIVLIPPDPHSGERGNLDEVMAISKHMWERNVSTTYCPIIWRSHKAQHGRHEEAYLTNLELTHSPLLREVVSQLVEAQLSGEGKIRNSRAYIEGIPYAGVDQLIGWHTIPKTGSISPNGRQGWDPMFKTLQEVFHAPGSYYGYEDHQGKWVNFRPHQYLPMLELELKKWEEIVKIGRPVATKVDPLAMVDTIRNAISFWQTNLNLISPTNRSDIWWDNTIKNTKVGKYKGLYRKDIPPHA